MSIPLHGAIHATAAQIVHIFSVPVVFIFSMFLLLLLKPYHYSTAVMKLCLYASHVVLSENEQ